MMQQHFHAVVWLDHLQARTFHLGLSGTQEVILHPQMPTRHIHHKANSIGSGHVHESAEFLHQILDAVSDAGEILILGPSGTKIELAIHARPGASKYDHSAHRANIGAPDGRHLDPDQTPDRWAAVSTGS
jgi:hypothetical protein